MEVIFATQSSMPILGQIAYVLGWVMDGIFRALDSLFNIQNIGLCIIIFTLLIYLLMTPLQIKQQKFSKLSAVMQPEIQAIQNKYKNKRDQVSMQKMQEETSMVYQKYGVSPTGSCVQLLITLPILMSLWQVIYKIPGYVGSVKAVFEGVVSQIVNVNGYTEIIQNFVSDNKITRAQVILENGQATSDSIIDVLYALSPSQWEKFADISQFSGFSDIIDSTASQISHMQNFLGLNIADQPWTIFTSALAAGSIILVIAAVLIPVLAWFTQWLNYKLMPQASSQDDQQNAMMNSMKTMNTMMPIMSAVFCVTFPVGVSLYWIAGAVFRSIQQVIINRHMSKINMDDLIAENMKKLEKKREKEGLPAQKITSQAHQNVRNIESKNRKEISEENRKKLEASYENSRNAKPGSLAAKANMVRDFDERNKKKK